MISTSDFIDFQTRSPEVDEMMAFLDEATCSIQAAIDQTKPSEEEVEGLEPMTRKEKNRQRVALRRSLETDEQRERRLLGNRTRIAIKRANESELEREQRLEKVRKHLAEKRASETAEEREKRLETNRKRIAKKREQLMNEEVVPVSMATNSTVQSASGVSSGHSSKPKVTPQTNGSITIVLAETKQESNLEIHYNELLRLIGEIGKDVKPAYTNNKVSTDRLRRSIMIARGVLRECLSDLDKLAASSHSSTGY